MARVREFTFVVKNSLCKILRLLHKGRTIVRAVPSNFLEDDVKNFISEHWESIKFYQKEMNMIY